MATDLTAEEVRQQYLEAMGPELGREFYLLSNECSWLHLNWEQYVILFGTNESRINLMNSAAASFFRLVQDTFWKGTLLHLSRLTDPPRSVGKDNLTLQRLPLLVSDEIRPAVEEHLGVVMGKCAFARDWRKRRIAHRDLQLALKENVVPLANASRLAVREALQAVASLMNKIDSHYRNTSVAYEVISSSRNAYALLFVLRDGLAMAQRRDKLVESGEWDHPDVNPAAP